MSLPLRKCGLKSQDSIDQARSKLSLPLRKCGLKYPVKTAKTAAGESLPLRKCGLKSISSVTDRSVNTVTSLAEVWIEIRSARPCLQAPGHFPCGSVD